MTNADRVPRRRRDLYVQVVGDEAIVLDRANERVHQLNGVATFILQCCDGSLKERGIVDRVVDRFDVSTARAASDVTDLLERIRSLGVLESD